MLLGAFVVAGFARSHGCSIPVVLVCVVIAGPVAILVFALMYERTGKWLSSRGYPTRNRDNKGN